MLREISLDTETTGLDPNAGHKIVEIGCVEMIGHIRTGKVFHVYINPGRDMPKEAEAVHGLSGEFLKDKPLFKEIAAEFVEFIGKSPMVIHNAAFDLKFINFELNALGLPIYPVSQTIDTVLLARKMFPGSPANLDALCRRFNIDLSMRTKHGALLDAELLSDVYLELRGGRQSNLELSPQSSTSNHLEIVESKKIEIRSRSFPASAEEKAAHALFLSKISDPIWKKLLPDGFA